MKKTYIQPATTTTALEGKTNLMNFSFPGDGSNGSIGVSDTPATGDGLARPDAPDLWAEDEE